jgi:hypothetical protein
MAWSPIHQVMLQVVVVWALLNVTIITGLTALFFVENAWSAVMRRRHPRARARVIRISGR